jgi:hypothetical protein
MWVCRDAEIEQKRDTLSEGVKDDGMRGRGVVGQKLKLKE